MAEHYKHTQRGTLIIVLLSIGMAADALVSGLSPDRTGNMLIFAILAISMMLFATLRVVIDDEYVRLSFGIGLIRTKFAISEITSCEIVRNKWYHGWGIHYIGNGTLYNVSGLDAVEIVMGNGRKYRIGTDEPQKLLAAVKSAIRK